MSEDVPGYGRTEEGVGTNEEASSPSPAAAGEGMDAQDAILSQQGKGVDVEIASLRELLAAAQAASTQALAEAEAARAEAESHRAAANESEGLLRQAQDERLAAHRRALLAENAGQIVAELVNGTTADELDASIATAREAYGRIAGELRAQAALQVPIGASAAVGQTPEELSPMQKITAALSRNSRN